MFKEIKYRLEMNALSTSEPWQVPRAPLVLTLGYLLFRLGTYQPFLLQLRVKWWRIVCLFWFFDASWSNRWTKFGQLTFWGSFWGPPNGESPAICGSWLLSYSAVNHMIICRSRFIVKIVQCSSAAFKYI